MTTGISAAELAAYVEQLITATDTVLAAQCAAQIPLQLPDATVTIRLAAATLLETVMPALRHLEAGPAAAHAVAIGFDGVDALANDVIPPLPPFTAADYRRFGQRAIMTTAEHAVMHAPVDGLLFAYDVRRRRGVAWYGDGAALSIYERAAPLQTLFHWALREFGWQVLHAAAVGHADGGLLLIGNSGAGKSTTSLSCLLHPGLQFLSDDKCLVRLQPQPEVLALFSSGKLKADMLERLPELRASLAGWDPFIKDGKGLAFLYPAYAERLVGRFPLLALVMPKVAYLEQAVYQRAPAGDAFRTLGPSTVIWLPGAEADNYRFSAALTRSVASYRFDLAIDPQANVAGLTALLAERKTELMPG
jgi:hypothetical protein